MPTTFANSIDSNPIYAARAENDKDGNRIDTTYAKLDDIPSGTQLVPAATSADANKVLTVDSQGVPGWAAGGGGGTYTAGDGISIDENDEISAKLGDGLEIGTSVNQVTATAHAVGNSSGVSIIQPLDASLVAAIAADGITYTIQNLIDDSEVSKPWKFRYARDCKLYPAITRIDSSSSAPSGGLLVLSTTGVDLSEATMGDTSGNVPAGTEFVYDLNDINTTLSTTDWATISANPANYALCVMYNDNTVLTASGNFTTLALYDAGTLSYQSEVTGAIVVSNPLPASTVGDAGRVLTVDNSGAAAWATPATVTVDQTYNSASTNAQSGTAVAGALATIDEVPAVTSSDDDKVLKASYSGGTGSYSWEAEPTVLGIVAGSNVTITEGVSDITIAATDTTYTAGNMIAIDANNSNAIGVSTTAGITDIQQVAALPADPVSTVLYLIPET